MNNTNDMDDTTTFSAIKIHQMLSGLIITERNDDIHQQGSIVLRNIYETRSYVQNILNPDGTSSTEAQTNDLPPNEVVRELTENPDTWRVLVKEGGESNLVSAQKVSENPELMDSIEQFIQSLSSDVMEVSMVWIPTRDHPDIKVLYCIEWDCEELNDLESDGEGGGSDDGDAVENITTMTQDVIQSLMMSNIDEEERDDLVRQLQEWPNN